MHVTLRYDLLKVCLRAKEKPHSLFIALPRTVLSFPLWSGSQMFVLSEVAWQTWKCFAIFCKLVWLLHGLSYFRVLLHAFYKVKKMICDLSSAEVLLERTTLPAKHYLANIHVEAHILCSLWTRQNNSNTQFDLN